MIAKEKHLTRTQLATQTYLGRLRYQAGPVVAICVVGGLPLLQGPFCVPVDVMIRKASMLIKESSGPMVIQW
jgi:hypothetical protein